MRSIIKPHPVSGLSNSLRNAAASSFPEHYRLRDVKPLVIAISRSGDTTEVKLAVDRLRRDYGARSFAITTEGNEVANVCEAGIVFKECLERSAVMTQAFTSLQPVLLPWLRSDERAR